jgi:O-methyltransferase
VPLSEVAGAYLDLMEQILTGILMQDPPIVTERHRNYANFIARSLGSTSELAEETLAEYQLSWRENGMDCPSHAFTMIGRRRLRNFRELIGRAIADGIPGDILETGVWRGGASIMARAVLRAWDDPSRKVFVADSFEGLPPPSYAQDAGSDLHEQPELAVSLEDVRDNFARLDLLDERVVFLKGWFKDTMPVAPIARLAVMRLDGDMYESTIDPLNHMFDKVSAGGWVIIDDYFIPSCRAAVMDFLGARGLSPEILPIDEFSAYFQKI